MSASYPIPGSQTRHEIRVLNSRFVTTVANTEDTATVKDLLNNIRAEMPSANHHVYAFRVGFGNSVIEGMSDDGEPSGTSGPPTLQVLRGSGLGDVTIVTSRFFGGTKLGTGGLVRAYTEAARQALAFTPAVEKVARSILVLDLPYSLYDLVHHALQKYDAIILKEDFAAHIQIELAIRSSQVSSFHNEITSISAGAVSPVIK